MLFGKFKMFLPDLCAAVSQLMVMASKVGSSIVLYGFEWPDSLLAITIAGCRARRLFFSSNIPSFVFLLNTFSLYRQADREQNDKGDHAERSDTCEKQRLKLC